MLKFDFQKKGVDFEFFSFFKSEKEMKALKIEGVKSISKSITRQKNGFQNKNKKERKIFVLISCLSDEISSFVCFSHVLENQGCH